MRSNRKLKIIISLIAILIAGLHLTRPELKIDSITVVLLIVCALPWIQPLIKSIELLGVKFELQELRDKLDETRGNTRELSDRVAKATGAAESATQQAEVALTNITEIGFPALGENVPQPRAEIMLLVDEYQRLRDDPSGASRTKAMTEVVRRMMDAARHTPIFETVEALRSDARESVFSVMFIFLLGPIRRCFCR